jgi:hypothetical protein
VDLVSKVLMGSISTHAIAYNASTKHLYVGFGPTFAVLNVRDRAHPALVGWADVATNASITGLAYPGSGTTVYAAAGLGGLLKIDVSDPASPSKTGTCSLAGYAWDLQLVGGQAFVADGIGVGLAVVDTATMTLTTSYNTPQACRDVAVLGNYAYVADGTSLLVLDISVVPPVLTGSYATGNSQGVSALYVGATPRVFVADSSSPDLRVLDASNPSAPSLLGSLETTGSGADVWVDPTASLAYLANGWGGLRVVSVSDPANPVETKSYDGDGDVTGLVLDGQTAFLAAGTSMDAVDTAPATPSLLGTYLCGTANTVTARDGYAFVASSKGVVVVDVRVPERPRSVSRTDGVGVQDLALDGNYLYQLHGAMWSINDISDLDSPVEVFSDWLPTTGRGLAVSGGYAYLAASASGLLIYDVSLPASAHLVGSLDTSGDAYDICLTGDYAYVADFSPGVQVIDVSDPSAPSLWATLPTPGSARGVKVSGQYLYVAEDTSGFEIYDVSVPSYPIWLTGEDTTGTALSLEVAGGIAYVADYWNGLRVLDVSVPWAPSEAGFFDSDSNAMAAFTADGYAYLADGSGGAYLLHYSGACLDEYEPNDFFAEAHSVTAGTLYDTKICTAEDYDYYELALSEGGTVGAVLHPPSGLDYDLFLYSSGQVLLASSMTAGDAAENLAFTTASEGTFYLLVRGHDGTQFSSAQFYTLVPSFTPCAAPVHSLLIYMGRKDANDDVILDILDPNQPSAVTGYNIYRDTVPNPAAWTLHAANVADADQGTANVQYIDLGSNAGGPYYYIARAVNASCGAEGP